MSTDRKYGYVLLPVATNCRNGESFEAAIERHYPDGVMDLEGPIEHYSEDAGLNTPSCVEAGSEYEAIANLAQLRPAAIKGIMLGLQPVSEEAPVYGRPLTVGLKVTNWSPGHTTASFFAGRNPDARGRSGELVFRNDEWDELQPVFEALGWSVSWSEDAEKQRSRR